MVKLSFQTAKSLVALKTHFFKASAVLKFRQIRLISILLKLKPMMEMLHYLRKLMVLLKNFNRFHFTIGHYFELLMQETILHILNDP